MFPRAGGLRSSLSVAVRITLHDVARRVHRPGERGGPAPPRSPHGVHARARPPRRSAVRPAWVPPTQASVRPSPRQRAAWCYARHVNALKAHVKNGRIIVDQPTDLPEGTELYLVPAEPEDDMTAEERAELEAAIEEGAEDFERGDFDNAREFALRLAAKA